MAERATAEVPVKRLDFVTAAFEEMLHFESVHIAQIQWGGGLRKHSAFVVYFFEEPVLLQRLLQRVVPSRIRHHDAASSLGMGERSQVIEGAPGRSHVCGDQFDTGIEYVENQPAPVRQMLADACQGPALVVGGHQVKERPVRYDRQRKAPFQAERPHIAFDDLHTPPRFVRQRGDLATGHLQHRRRPVQADDGHARFGDRDHDPAGSARDLQHGAVRLFGLLNVERLVAVESRRVTVVQAGVRPVVFRHVFSSLWKHTLPSPTHRQA